ncbi:hypothetical protein LTR39_005602, partial [Cryomyces antarcticus]
IVQRIKTRGDKLSTPGILQLSQSEAKFASPRILLGNDILVPGASFYFPRPVPLSYIATSIASPADKTVAVASPNGPVQGVRNDDDDSNTAD